MMILISIIFSIIISDKIDQINMLTKAAEISFKKEDFQESIEKYTILIDSFNYTNEKVYLNLAHSYLLSEDTINATENYNYASLTDNSKIKSIALQQLGNINEKKNKLKDALNFYKASIIADNQNNDSKYNYELIKKKLENKKDQKENSQKENSQDKNKKESSDKKQNDDKGKQDKEKNEKNNEEKSIDNEKNNAQNKKEESIDDKLKKINMSKKKAEMILNALNNNELQYIQQLKRKPTKKTDKNKPDW